MSKVRAHTPPPAAGAEMPRSRFLPRRKRFSQQPVTRRQRSQGSTHRVIAVAIAGGSGSGKTWLARRLRLRLRPHAVVLPLDDFYRDLSHLTPAQRSRVNFDRPDALDWDLFCACLEGLLRNEPVRTPRYDYVTHTRLPRGRLREPRPIVLVEGLWPWWRRDVARQYTLKIYCDTPSELRFERRRERDVRERGRTVASVERQWREQSEPMFARYVRPLRQQADFIFEPELPLKQLEILVPRIRWLANPDTQ